MWMGTCFGGHTYTLASVGLHKNYDKSFLTRQAANEYMYELLGRNNLHVIETYDDKHTKTYICNQGVRFVINRI